LPFRRRRGEAKGEESCAVSIPLGHVMVKSSFEAFVSPLICVDVSLVMSPQGSDEPDLLTTLSLPS
jgi:hypothetical protein